MRWASFRLLSDAMQLQPGDQAHGMADLQLVYMCFAVARPDPACVVSSMLLAFVVATSLAIG